MKIKRTLCMLLALMMVFSIAFPTTIFADDLFDEIVLDDADYTLYEEPIDEVPAVNEEPLDEVPTVNEELIDEVPTVNEEPSVEEIFEDEIAEPSFDEAVIKDTIVENVQPEAEAPVVVAEDEVKNEELEPEAAEAPIEVVEDLSLTETSAFGSGITITKQPEDAAAELGQYAIVKVEAEGSNLTYQWYYKTVNDSEFKASTKKTNTYRVKMSETQVGMQLFCRISDGTNSVDSNIVTLRLPAAITITKQPEDAAAALGQYATVKVEAEGENLTYQWYYKTVNDSEFKASSQKTNTYRVKMTATQVGMQLFCKINNGDDSVDSNIVTLSLPGVITITKQPEDTAAALGQDVTVTVVAEGNNLTYQWYCKTINDSEFKADSQKTNTYRVKMSETQVGMQLFCKISDGTNSVDSNIVTLSLSGVITITEQPEDAAAALGQYATVKVEAEGSNLTYQWYYKTVNDSEFKASTKKTNTYRAKMTSTQVGMQLFCRISDGTNSVDSNIVTLSLPAIVDGDFVFEKIGSTNNLALIEYKGNNSSITVPGTVNGMTVTEIGHSPLADGEKGVFEGNTTLTSVALPNSITAIRERAFKGCTNLSSMSTY